MRTHAPPFTQTSVRRMAPVEVGRDRDELVGIGFDPLGEANEGPQPDGVDSKTRRKRCPTLASRLDHIIEAARISEGIDASLE